MADSPAPPPIPREQPTWHLRETPETCADLCASPLGTTLPSLVLKLLAQRGITSEEEASDFLQPLLAHLGDPFDLPDMRAAVDRLFSAIDRGERITLFGDYDVDGVTSLTVLHAVITAYGGKVEAFVPERMTEGYGLGLAALERCLEQTRPELVVAVDCGTNSRDEVAELARQKIECIIIDHHEPSSEGMAECRAVVNPKRDGHLDYLCSAGLAFKVAHALLKDRKLDDFDLREYLDLVAVGTVADIVPLVGENRVLVRKGLNRLDHTRHAGLVQLKRVAGVPDRAQTAHIGFRIGPRINAAGRLASAQDSLDLMLCDCHQLAGELANALDSHNRERQGLEKAILKELDEQVAEACKEAGGGLPAAFVLAGDNWHPGVVGIVASRVTRTYHRPAIVLGRDGEGRARGSGRSIPGINVYAALGPCGRHLVSGGGHEQAIGLTVKAGSLAEFRKDFVEAIAKQATPELLRPRIVADAEVALEELTMSFLDQYELLEPFGSGNPQPVLCAREVTTPTLRPINGGHLKIVFAQGSGLSDAVYFNPPPDLPDTPWDIAFTLDRNHFRGNETVQLNVRAIRAASPDLPPPPEIG